MKKKKVLILHAPVGVGHGAAARALAEAFALKYPDVQVKNIDVLDFVSDVFRQSLPWVYGQTTMKVPIIYKWIYDYFQSRDKILSNASRVILKKSRFVKFIKNFNPDFIISTYPLSMQLVSLTKEKKIIDIPSANVCTDFGYHSLWNNADVNYYFVACEEVKRSLAKHNVKSSKIKIIGIPTSAKFSKVLDRGKIINNLGFDISKPVLLIVGGRISYRNLLEIINGVKEKNSYAQFIVVTGRDEALLERLKDSSIKNDLNVRIFGFINNLDEFMASSDLIITKAGGLTVSECLIKGLPMVINDIIPGQEEDNIRYIVKHGAGVEARGNKQTVKVISKLFLHAEKLSELKKNCKKLAKPAAATDIADFIVSKI